MAWSNIEGFRIRVVTASPKTIVVNLPSVA